MATASSTTKAIADCGLGKHVTGGGVTGLADGNNQGMTGSFPSDSTGAPVTIANPRYWTVTGSGRTFTAYATCVAN